MRMLSPALEQHVDDVTAHRADTSATRQERGAHADRMTPCAQVGYPWVASFGHLGAPQTDALR